MVRNVKKIKESVKSKLTPSFWIVQDEESEKLGEDFSISAITRKYVKNKNAKVRNIGKGTWVDCGTPDGLLQASLMAKNKEITTRRD